MVVFGHVIVNNLVNYLFQSCYSSAFERMVMHFKKLISCCITSANNEILSILSIYLKKVKWCEIALTCM